MVFLLEKQLKKDTHASNNVHLSKDPPPFTAIPGETVDIETVQLKNDSQVIYDISDATITGEDRADFSVSSCVDPSLRPSAKCNIAITYQPSKSKAPGVSRAILTIDLTALSPASEPAATVIVGLAGVATTTCSMPYSSFFPLSRPTVKAGTVNCYF